MNAPRSAFALLRRLAKRKNHDKGLPEKLVYSRYSQRIVENMAHSGWIDRTADGCYTIACRGLEVLIEHRRSCVSLAISIAALVCSVALPLLSTAFA